MYMLQLSGLTLKRFGSSSMTNCKLVSFARQQKIRGKVGGYRKCIGLWFREQSLQITQACARQFEFVVAQRVRRSFQIFHLYTRIWDEVALREFIKSWRRRLSRNTKGFLVGAIGVTTYNWDKERISDQEMNRYSREIEWIHKLKDSTVVCAKCHLKRMIGVEQPGIQYCKCHGVRSTAASGQAEGWQPFIERQDMLVWRKEEPGSRGLYAYKVYGSFPEVTADDFVQVQLDVDYRKQWDPTARELQIIETDPKSKTSQNNSTDVIYWEMIWPRLFANRDYVYQRRWIIDRDKGLIVIVSKVTEHPGAPSKSGTYRVTTYWSYMVIKPYTEFHQPGIEFGLTYFDDPGVNVPSAVTAWVAMTGLPDFIRRMRQASKDYKDYKTLEGRIPSVPDNYLDKEKTVVGEVRSKKSTEEEGSRTDDALKEETKGKETLRVHVKEEKDEKVKEEKRNGGTKEKRDKDEKVLNQDQPEEEARTEGSVKTTSEKDQRLHHFFITRLFA